MFDIDPNTVPLILGMQEMPRDLPGETTQPFTPGDAGAGRSPADGGSMGPFIFILFVVLLAMIIMSVMGNRRERKKREAMIASIKKHDKVQTIGGVIGSIVELKPDFVVLKVDESSNTRITFARSAIQQVIKSSSAGGNAEPETGEKEPAQQRE